MNRFQIRARQRKAMNKKQIKFQQLCRKIVANVINKMLGIVK